MFLEKLDINKKQVIIIGIVTLIFIAALGLFIGLLDVGVKDSPTDLDFLGFQFTVGETEVVMRTPTEGQIITEINDDTIHELEALSEAINAAHVKWMAAIRNAMIFLYLLFFVLMLLKKKETYFQGIFKGFLIGATLLLFLFVLNSFFEARTLLISFDHHLGHMLF